MTWFVFEYPLVYLSCSITESRNDCVSNAELMISFWRKYFIENFSVFLHSDILQRVLMWSSGPLLAAATHATLTKHTTCNVTKQHLSILFSGNRPIVPNHWNNYRPLNTVSVILAMVPVVVVLWCVLPPLQLEAGNLFFCCWSSLSIGSILCSPIWLLYYSCSLLSFRTPFCLSIEWRATVRHGAAGAELLCYRCILDFGAGEGDGYLDPIKCPPMRLYAQDGCVLKNSWFFNESGVSSIWNLPYMGISTAAFKK